MMPEERGERGNRPAAEAGGARAVLEPFWNRVFDRIPMLMNTEPSKQRDEEQSGRKVPISVK
jgi:hypothetical protein